MTRALSRLTKDLIVTTNFHSNNVQACPNAPGEIIGAGAIGQTCARSKLSYIVAR